jgi:ribonuclease BN (tRNA processing enzyme)
MKTAAISHTFKTSMKRLHALSVRSRRQCPTCVFDMVLTRRTASISRSERLLTTLSDTSSSAELSPSPNSNNCNNKHGHEHTNFYGTRVFVEASSALSSQHSSILSSHPLKSLIKTAISRSALFTPTTTDQHPDTTSIMSSSSVIHKDMSIVFLGTGAGGRPNTHRNPSSLCLRFHGVLILVDVGEGTQKQLALSSCLDSRGYLDIEKILITHMHADHVNGLPGLILQIHDAARNRYEQQRKNTSSSISTSATNKEHAKSRNDTTETMMMHKLDIYGPPGLYHFLCMNMILTRSFIPYLSITVHELMGGMEERRGMYKYNTNTTRGGEKSNHKKGIHSTQTPIKKKSHQSTMVVQPFPSSSNNNHVPMDPSSTTQYHTSTLLSSTHSSNDNTATLFDSFPWKHPNIHQKSISKQEKDSTWILQQPLDSSQLTPEQAMHYSPTHCVSQSLTLRAAEIFHQRGVQTFGYVLEEKPSLPKIQVDKAMALGISPGKKYRLLKQGLPVQNNDGVWIHPHQVLIQDDDESTTTSSSPRKVVVLGDHYQISEEMMKLCQNAHVLVSEATLMDISDASVSTVFFVFRLTH